MRLARLREGFVQEADDDLLIERFRYARTITIEGPPPPKPDFTFKLKIILGFLVSICIRLRSIP